MISLLNPASGKGEVEININPGGVASNLPVDWNSLAGIILYPTKVSNAGYYTTDIQNTDSSFQNLGNGYGGIIVGRIEAPFNDGTFNSDTGMYDDTYSLILNIYTNSITPVSIDLLRTQETKVSIISSGQISPGSSGYIIVEDGICQTPRNAYVYLCIPPDTYFEIIEEPSSISYSSNNRLEFHPYIVSSGISS